MIRKTAANKARASEEASAFIMPECAAFRKQAELMAPRDGSFACAFPGIRLTRLSRPSAQLVHAVHKPAFA